MCRDLAVPRVEPSRLCDAVGAGGCLQVLLQPPLTRPEWPCTLLAECGFCPAGEPLSCPYTLKATGAKPHLRPVYVSRIFLISGKKPLRTSAQICKALGTLQMQ